MRKTTTDSSSNRSGSIDTLPRRRRRQREDGNNFDGLAASRAKAAKREAEEEVIEQLAMRLQSLWEELKIPSPDRAYVSAAYLEAGGRDGGTDGDGSRGAKGKVANGVGSTSARTSVDVHHELVRQIRLLLEHRAATIEVRGVRWSVAFHPMPAVACQKLCHVHWPTPLLATLIEIPFL